MFTGAAAERAHARSRENRRASRYSRIVPSSGERSSKVVHDIRLDTVDSMVWSASKEAEYLNEYRGLSYFISVRDVVDIEEFHQLGKESFAEKLLFFQTARTLRRLVRESPLEPLYRSISKQFKKVRDYTTLRVEQRAKGLDVERGRGEDPPLLELKLHASAREGIEPRLKIGKYFVLRHDPLRQQTLLELQKHF